MIPPSTLGVTAGHLQTRERERERVCVCVCVREREREREDGKKEA